MRWQNCKCGLFLEKSSHCFRLAVSLEDVTEGIFLPSFIVCHFRKPAGTWRGTVEEAPSRCLGVHNWWDGFVIMNSPPWG